MRRTDIDNRLVLGFAIQMGAVVAVFFGLILPSIGDTEYPVWPWGLAIAMLMIGSIAPRILRPIYAAWIALSLLLSRVTNPILLAFVFFVVILPIGIVMRLFRDDPLRRRFESNTSTYRIPSDDRPIDQLRFPF